MATKKISEMAAADTLDGTELVPVIQDGVNVRTTAAAIAAAASGDPAPSFLPNFQIRGIQYSHAVNTGAAIGYDGTVGWTTEANISHPALDGTDSVIKSKPRQRQTSNVSANVSCGFRAPNASGIFWKASAAAQGGGFDIEFIGGFLTVRADQTIFVGYDATQSFTSFDDAIYSDKVNIAAFAKDEADANLKFMYNDGSGNATEVDTGVVATTLGNKLLKFRLYSDATSIGYSLTNLESNTVLASGSVSGANVPASDTALMWKFVTGTGATTTTAVTTDLIRVMEIQPDRATLITVP